jgi:uncharacterized protein YjdB
VSSDPLTAKATLDGEKIKVTGLKAGNADIIIKDASEAELATATVAVSESGKQETVYPTSIVLNKSSLDLVYASATDYETGTLTVAKWVADDATKTVTVQNVTDAISGNTSIASVDRVGDAVIVTAEGEGETFVTVYAEGKNNTTVPVKCTVTVTAPPTPGLIAVDSLSLDTAAKTMTGGKVETLGSPVFSPLSASNQEVVWSTSDETIATVDAKTGEVKAIAEGTAIITVKSVEKYTAYDYCTITVEAEQPAPTPAKVVKDITVKSSSGSSTLDIGTPTNYLELVATVTYTDGTSDNKDVDWSLVNTSTSVKVTETAEGVCKVERRDTESGAAPTDPVMVKATVGTKYTVFPVTIKKTNHIATVTVTPATISNLGIGATRQLSVSVTSNTGSLSGLDKSVSWKSMNSLIATVTDDGLVQGYGNGTCEIIATSNENPDAVGTCTVTVSGTTPVVTQTIKVTPSAEDVVIDGTVTLTPEASPSGASDVFEWSTSDTAGTYATFNKNTLVLTGKSVGTVTITAKATDGSGVSGSTTVNVIPVARPAKVTGVKASYKANGNYGISFTKNNSGTTPTYYKIVIMDGTNEAYSRYVASTVEASTYDPVIIPAATFTTNTTYKVYVYATTGNDPANVDEYVESTASDVDSNSTFIYK